MEEWQEELREGLERRLGEYETLTSMAADLGMDVSVLWRIIYGQRNIGPSTLARIAKVFPDLVTGVFASEREDD